MTSGNENGRDLLRERPFYFMMNVWGDEYRWMFLNLCLASLLSPNNIPALVNKANSRFLILSPRRDLDALDGEPLIAKLRQYINVELIEIPTPGVGDDKFDLNTYSYKLAADRCFADKAYGLFLCPDTLLSEGTIVALQERARRGAKVVLVAALRHDQHAIISELKQSNSIRLGEPITLPPRDMMKLGLAHLHPQAFLHDWNGGHFNSYPGFALWRAPVGDGLLLHTMRWNPLLISYADIREHQTWSRFGGAGHIGMDDDYIFNNFCDDDRVEAVSDTDEIAYVSLTPIETAVTNSIAVGEFSKRICLRVMAYSGTMDPLQWRLFRTHIRIHSGDITPEWNQMEREADSILDAALARPPNAFDRLWQRYFAARSASVVGRRVAAPHQYASAKQYGGTELIMLAAVNLPGSLSPRPLYFMTSFWGKGYRQYFVDRCLPSLLASGNFPELRAGDGHRLLIATTAGDRQAMESLPIMEAVRSFVTPFFVEVDHPVDQSATPGSDNVIRHHAKCQRLLCEIAFQDRSYGSVVFPDTIYSTGAVAALLRYHGAGYNLVLCSALRQTEEHVIDELVQSGRLPSGAPLSLSARPLEISQRSMADLAVRHLHPEVTVYDWDDPDAPPICAHRYWHVPSRRGLIVRTFYGVPVLMNYGAIERHDTACLDEDIFENVYVRRNFSSCGSLHVVQDSDEFMLISLTPAAVGHRHVAPKSGSLWFRDFLRKCGLRASMNQFVGRPRDGLKGALFNSPIRWHADDLDKTWTARELEIATMMRRWIGDYGSEAQALAIRFPSFWTLSPRRFLGNTYLHYIQSPRAHIYMHYLSVISDALRGRGDAPTRLWAAIRRRLSLTRS